jgi:hypothetical protein
MSLPRPLALRFVGRGTPPRRVPFGLAAWSVDHDAGLVLAADAGDTEAALAALPAAESLAPGALVVVLAARENAGFWGRLLGRRAATDDHGARASGLLARGYVDIGGAFDPTSDEDVVWGYAPIRPS